MTADSLYVLPAPLTLTPSQVGDRGRFRIVNRGPGPTISIVVHLTTDRGATDAEITRVGDSLSFDLTGVRFIEIEASSYPASILLESTELPIELEAAPVVGNTAADPVFVTGDLGAWVIATQYPDQTGFYGVGQGALVSKVATIRDGRTPFVVVPTGPALSLAETYITVVELPASGGTPRRIDAADAFASDAGGAYAFAIPDIGHVGALVDILGMTDDPDFMPPVDVVVPAPFTHRVTNPRTGAARVSQSIETAPGYGGDGLSYSGNVIGGLDMRIVRATFANATAVPVQTAVGWCAPGAPIVWATLSAPPTPGNLLIALATTLPGSAPATLGLMGAGTLAGV